MNSLYFTFSNMYLLTIIEAKRCMQHGCDNTILFIDLKVINDEHVMHTKFDIYRTCLLLSLD